jgi:GTP-binding protein
MLDEELIAQMKRDLPDDVKTLFISSVSGAGISELKDLIWEELNKETNKLVEMVHKPIEVAEMLTEEDEMEIEVDEFDDEDDLSKYKGIGWDEQ